MLLSILEFETFFKTNDGLDWIVSCVLRPMERFSACFAQLIGLKVVL